MALSNFHVFLEFQPLQGKKFMQTAWIAFRIKLEMCCNTFQCEILTKRHVLNSACEFILVQKAISTHSQITEIDGQRFHRTDQPCPSQWVRSRVLRGLKFCVRSRPAPVKFKPAPQTITTRAQPALFRSQTRTCPKTTKKS